MKKILLFLTLIGIITITTSYATAANITVWDKIVGQTPFPEPLTILLLGIGLLGLARIGRKRTS